MNSFAVGRSSPAHPSHMSGRTGPRISVQDTVAGIVRIGTSAAGHSRYSSRISPPPTDLGQGHTAPGADQVGRAGNKKPLQMEPRPVLLSLDIRLPAIASNLACNRGSGPLQSPRNCPRPHTQPQLCLDQSPFLMIEVLVVLRHMQLSPIWKRLHLHFESADPRVRMTKERWICEVRPGRTPC